MLRLLTFNKIRKVFSLVLLIFLVLPLSRCERLGYSSERKLVSEAEFAKAQESKIQEPKLLESKPSMAMDFYVCIYIWEGFKKIDGDGWDDRLLFIATFLSFMAMIFLPLLLWRVTDMRSAVILLSASPAIAYGIFISVWLWPIQLLAGYLLTLIWALLFALSLVQINRYFLERKNAQNNS